MITVLTGPNSYAIAESLRVKTSSFHGEVERFDGSELEARHLPDIFMGATLFAPERLVVLREVSSNKAVWNDLEQWIERVPVETEILMVEPSPDKRTRAYKSLQKHATIQEHTEPNEASLRAWLQAHVRQQNVELAPDVLAYLLSYVGHDQWRLRAELEKLLLAEKPITKELIQDVAEPYSEASAFELLDRAFAGDKERTLVLLAQLREREDPYQFFGLLSSQVMALLSLTVAGARRPDEVARDMGVHPFVLRKLTSVARDMGRDRVAQLVERLARADARIKTGADPWQQLEITLLGV